VPLENIFELRAHFDRAPHMLLIQLKYKRNSHYFGDKFGHTFCHLHIFGNRFHCCSAFLLYFGKTPMMAIFTAISVNGNNSHYGHYGHKYGLYVCLFQNIAKCRSILKTVSQNMQMVKSNGQNKFIAKIKAISLVFRFD
jgi:hypothetical protein